MRTARPESFGKERLLARGLVVPATFLVLLVVVLPIILLFRYSFNQFDPQLMVVDVFTLQNYVDFWNDDYYRNVLFTTLWVAALCTVLALIIGFPVAYYLARTHSRLKSLLIILLIFPLVVGGVVRAAGWMVILGNAGFVNTVLIYAGIVEQPLDLLYTPLAVIVGTTAVVAPYMILTLQTVIEGIDSSIEEAAQNLGGNFLIVLWRILLPVAAPGVAAGTLLVFILCMNAYAAPVLLGGSGVTMMAPALYDQISRASNWPFGSALAVILVVTTFVVAILSNWLIHRRYATTMES